MMLIKETTAEELAVLWEGSHAFAETLGYKTEHEQLVTTARIVLGTLQVKAEYRDSGSNA